MAVGLLEPNRQCLVPEFTPELFDRMTFTIGRLRPRDTVGVSLAAMRRYLASPSEPAEEEPRDDADSWFGSVSVRPAVEIAIEERWPSVDPAIVAALVLAMERTRWVHPTLNARDLLASVDELELESADGFAVTPPKHFTEADLAPSLNRLYAGEEVRIDLRDLGYHSAVIGALLLQIDGARVLRDPLRIVLQGKPDDVETSTVDEVADAVAMTLRKARPLQQRFRAAVLGRYGQVCAMCDITAAELLEAAHLLAVSRGGAYDADNGLVLCSNHHAAVDRGLVRIAPDTTRFVIRNGLSASALGLSRFDLVHLPHLPSRTALEGLWAAQGEIGIEPPA